MLGKEKAVALTVISENSHQVAMQWLPVDPAEDTRWHTLWSHPAPPENWDERLHPGTQFLGSLLGREDPISKAAGLDTPPPGHTLNKLCNYFLLFMNLDITGLSSKQVLSTCWWLNWAQECCQVTPVVMEYLSHVAIAVIYQKDHPQSPQSEPKAKTFSAWAK